MMETVESIELGPAARLCEELKTKKEAIQASIKQRIREMPEYEQLRGVKKSLKEAMERLWKLTRESKQGLFE